MNLFLVGWSPTGDLNPEPAERSLRALLGQLPFWESDPIVGWRAPSGRAALACVAHEPDRVGGVRYVDHNAHGFAVFSGRPFVWTGESEAEGQTPLNASYYRRPMVDWMEDLDGRCAAIRYDERDGTLELFADAMGAYPIYAGDLDGDRWISNSPELVRSVLGTHDVDLGALASLLASGWSLGGQPVWAGVRRLARGAVHTLRANDSDREAELLPLERIARIPGSGLDVERGAGALVAATSALCDWPGRPNVLQLSGGLDSRVVFAAARAGDADFRVVTAGTPELPDVRLARQICARADLDHELLSADPGSALHDGTDDAARILALGSGLAISLEHAGGYPFGPTTGTLPLWLNGQVGDGARAFYGLDAGLGRDELVEKLLRAEAGGPELLSARGRALVEAEVARAVDEALERGVAEHDVSDVFYLTRRSAYWAAVGHGCCEYAKGDTTAPLWSRRVLEYALAPPPDQRAQNGFHRAMLRRLDPGLDQLPLAEWVFQRPDADPFGRVFRRVRDAVRARASHPAWEVLDRDYVGGLLERDHRSLDYFGNAHVWRLATVFLPDVWGATS